jgi:Lyase
MHAALSRKATEFDDVIKIGRTHLADATPNQRARAKRQLILSLSTYSSGQGTIGKNLHVSKMLTKSLLKHLFNNMSSLLKQRVTTIFRLGTWLDTT